jgi:hypothetical protein
MRNKKITIIKKQQQAFFSKESVVHMESLEMIQYDRKDVDWDEVKRMAQDSSKRIQKEREDRLNKAIENHERYYIRKELENVSTYELIKMIISKF